MLRGAERADIGHFVEWVKERSHLTRGVTIGTMLRDEAFHFTRIGTFLERADSTARILTAHQSDLTPGADANAVPDPYEWSVLLRALSAFEVYRRVYRDVITPYKVAQMLILRDDMPRSLLRCCKEVYQNLKSVANEQSQETERRAGEMHAMLHFTRMEVIIADGLPHFLEQFLVTAARCGRSHRIGLPGPPGRGVIMQLHIRHETLYRYERPVKYSVQSLHLTPRRDACQRAITWTIPAPGRRLEQVDAYGNISHLLTIEQPHREIHIVVRGVVETADTEEPPGRWAALAARLSRPHARSPRRTRRCKAFAHQRFGERRRSACTRPRARRSGIPRGALQIRHKRRAGQRRPRFNSGEGVCQDHAHVYIASARALGIPARYVSGYLYTGDTSDAASHAWVDVWLGPDIGWQSLDVTH